MLKNITILFLIIPFLFAMISCGNANKNNSQASTLEVTESISDENEYLAQKNTHAVATNIDEEDDTNEMYTLTSYDLNIINYLSEADNNNSQRFESEVQLAKYLKIELIDKPTFDYKHAHEISYFATDTTEIKKVDGVIILKTKDDNVKLEDRPDAEENEIFYTYLGQYPVLDKYVVSSSGWEWWATSLYDKKTGEAEILTFDGFPYLSPKKDFLLSIDFNMYEDNTNISLFKITEEKEVNPIMNASYTKFKPSNDEEAEMFWSSDGYFYLSVVHMEASDHEPFQKQYARIKVLQ